MVPRTYGEVDCFCSFYVLGWASIEPPGMKSLVFFLGTLESAAPGRFLWRMGVGILPNFSSLLEPDVAMRVARASWF